VWLQTVGERRWFVLTKDQRLRYRPLEIAALRASKARVFVLTVGNLRETEIAALFLAALPRIYRAIDSLCGPNFTIRTHRDDVKLIWNVLLGPGRTGIWSFLANVLPYSAR
jgi:hypothetical protein